MVDCYERTKAKDYGSCAINPQRPRWGCPGLASVIIFVSKQCRVFAACEINPPGILRDLGGESGPDIYLLLALHEAWGGGVV